MVRNQSLYAKMVAAALSDEERDFIQNCLRENSLFSDLPSASIARLVDNFEKTYAKAGDVLVRQGETTKLGYVYLVGEGTCSVMVDGAMAPEPYNIIGPGKMFGELAFMCRCFAWKISHDHGRHGELTL